MATTTSMIGSLSDRIQGLPTDRVGQASTIVLTTAVVWALTDWNALLVAVLLVPITYAFGSVFGFVAGHVVLLALLPGPLSFTDMVLLEGALAVFLITATVTITPTRHALTSSLIAVTITVLGVPILISIVETLWIATISILSALVGVGYLLHRYEYYRTTVQELPK